MEKEITRGYQSGKDTEKVFTLFRQLNQIMYELSQYSLSESYEKVDDTVGINEEIDEVRDCLLKARDAFTNLAGLLVEYDIMNIEAEE